VLLAGKLNGAVIVAVIAIRVVEVAIHQIVDMPAMGYGLVSAVLTMFVFRVVSFTVVTIAALFRIRRTDIEPVLVDVTIM
jgi:hypothetical protein